MGFEEVNYGSKIMSNKLSSFLLVKMYDNSPLPVRSLNFDKYKVKAHKSKNNSYKFVHTTRLNESVEYNILRHFQTHKIDWYKHLNESGREFTEK